MRFDRYWTTLIAVLAAQTIAFGAATAQDTTTVRAGTLLRVAVDAGGVVHERLTSHDARRLFPRGTEVPGTVILAHPDSITLRDRDGTRTVAISDIARLEMAGGRHRHVLRGALIGAALGVAVGTLAGYSEGGVEGCNDAGTYCWEKIDAVEGAILFGVMGGGLGALVGLRSHQSWTTIPAPWRVVP